MSRKVATQFVSIVTSVPIYLKRLNSMAKSRCYCFIASKGRPPTLSEKIVNLTNSLQQRALSYDDGDVIAK